jgi:hypothetical protein
VALLVQHVFKRAAGALQRLQPPRELHQAALLAVEEAAVLFHVAALRNVCGA